jgi:Alpha mannosidase middle domain
VASNILAAARQLEVLGGYHPEGPNTAALFRAVALMQHHDAITGTDKQHVNQDYRLQLSKGASVSQSVSQSISPSVRPPLAPTNSKSTSLKTGCSFFKAVQPAPPQDAPFTCLPACLSPADPLTVFLFVIRPCVCQFAYLIIHRLDP